MSSTRRHFIKLSAAAGGALGLGLPFRSLCAQGETAAVKPMNILILGGTGFTGPFQVRYALGRGHKVTIFNRGKRPSDLPKEVEHLKGDRSGDLKALEGRKWDVVIDNPTTLPVWVRDAGQILQGHTDRYVFISTISVYKDGGKPEADENAPLQEYEGADAMKETRESLMASDFKLYGPLKVMAEREAEKWFPRQTLVVRPGLIVGPRDESDRFTYWPVRIDRGGEVLAPGRPTDPVQFIDARDLAEWTIRMVEERATGTFNATGKSMGIGTMLEKIKEGVGGQAKFTWLPADFLEKQKVSPWSDMPVWIPPAADPGAGRTGIQKALARGLTFRPVDETARETLAWFKSLPAARQADLGAGLTAEREKEVLAAWRQRQG